MVVVQHYNICQPGLGHRFRLVVETAAVKVSKSPFQQFQVIFETINQLLTTYEITKRKIGFFKSVSQTDWVAGQSLKNNLSRFL